MSKERIQDSPLTRARLTLGATKTPPPQQDEQSEEHKDIKTPRHKDAKAPSSQGATMRRTTVYIPDALAIKLKVYAARRREDVSGIITKQIELLLADER